MSLSSLVGKVAVITGASSGIGAATALEFARQGTRLLLHGRNEAALSEVVRQCERLNQQDTPNPKVSTVLGDMEEDQTLDSLVQTTLDTFGGLDVLFNNAGYKHPRDDAIHMGGHVDAMDAMYRICTRAPYLLSQAFIPALEKSGGCIINCSSIGTICQNPRITAYCSQKSAQNALTDAMAISLAAKGIRVNSICVGYVRTKLISRVVGQEKTDYFFDKMAALTPLGRKLTTSEEVASVVMFLASDMARAVTGHSIRIDRGAIIAHPMTIWDKL